MKRERSIYEYAMAVLWFAIVSAVGVSLIFTGGCTQYRGGKVIDGSNIAIGITIPGTEWTINALDYVGGIRVCGNDATSITVTNEVDETNSYFGVVTTERHTKMSAKIEPTESTPANDVVAKIVDILKENPETPEEK